jgi:hypothetical protein
MVREIQLCNLLKQKLENEWNGKILMIRQHEIDGWFMAFYFQQGGKPQYIDRYLDLFIHHSENIRHALSSWIQGFSMEMRKKLIEESLESVNNTDQRF